MIKARLSIVLLFALLLLSACSTLIMSNEESSLKEIEKKQYLLTKDIVNNGKVVLTKGTAVKLMVSTSSTWVKLYAVKSEDNPLSAQRHLALFVFDSDFENKVFNRDKFDAKLAEFAVETDQASELKKGSKKTPQKKK